MNPADLALLPVHPACAAFPRMAPEDVASLARSIAKNGQRDPVVVADGVLLDGRHRIEACGSLGIPVVVVGFDGEPGTEEAWIIDRNLERRHMTTGQKALWAARTMDGYTAAAKGRQGSAQDCAKGKASDAAGTAVGVSGRTVEQARAVVRDGVPELADAVESGEIAVSTAAGIAKLDRAEQAEVLKTMDPKAIKAHVAEMKAGAKEDRATKKREKDAARTEAAMAAAPAIEGVEIRCCTNAELLATLEPGSLAMGVGDPNWPYRDGQNGAAAKQYSLSGYDPILVDFERIYDAMADDTYLLVWCTFPIEREWHVATHLAGDRFRFRHITGGAWGKRVSDEDRKGVGYHQRGDAEFYLLYAKGNPKPYDQNLTNWHASTRTAHSEKPVRWLREALNAWCAPGGLVGEFWAGLAPTARACTLEGRRCVSAEMDPERHADAVTALVDRLHEEPIEWAEDDGAYSASVFGTAFSLSEDSKGWVLYVTRGAELLATRRPDLVKIISSPQARVWAVHLIAAAKTKGWT